MALRNYSRQRESIKTNLKQRHDHPTAEMIYADIRMQYPKVSLGTVYRNLALLEEDGEILKLTLAGGVIHYDGDTTPHHHVHCRTCGKIADLRLEIPADLLEAAGAQFQGTIDSAHMDFSGICEECEAVRRSAAN